MTGALDALLGAGLTLDLWRWPLNSAARAARYKLARNC